MQLVISEIMKHFAMFRTLFEKSARVALLGFRVGGVALAPFCGLPPRACNRYPSRHSQIRLYAVIHSGRSYVAQLTDLTASAD